MAFPPRHRSFRKMYLDTVLKAYLYELEDVVQSQGLVLSCIIAFITLKCHIICA